MSVSAIGWALREAPVTAKGDLLALIVLADHAHADGGGSYPSVSTIARLARLSERGARQALRNLEDLGVITDTGSKGPKGTTVYRLNLPEPATRVTAPVVQDPPATTAGGQPLPGGTHCREGAAATSGPPGNQTHPTPAATAPEPSLTVQDPSEQASSRPRGADHVEAVLARLNCAPVEGHAVDEVLLGHADRDAVRAADDLEARLGNQRVAAPLRALAGFLTQAPRWTAGVAPKIDERKVGRLRRLARAGAEQLSHSDEDYLRSAGYLPIAGGTDWLPAANAERWHEADRQAAASLARLSDGRAAA